MGVSLPPNQFTNIPLVTNVSSFEKKESIVSSKNVSVFEYNSFKRIEKDEIKLLKLSQIINQEIIRNTNFLLEEKTYITSFIDDFFKENIITIPYEKIAFEITPFKTSLFSLVLNNSNVLRISFDNKKDKEKQAMFMYYEGNNQIMNGIGTIENTFKEICELLPQQNLLS